MAPHRDDPFQLEAAVDVIEHYVRTTADRAGIVELLVHCLESGRLATEAYGDLFSEFYDTMLEVAERCADELWDQSELIEVHRERLGTVLRAASRVGWGYGDALYDILGQVLCDEDA